MILNAGFFVPNITQGYTNLEIILVDDGSPDRSGEICDQWAAKDGRIRVIHQANAGGAAARNVALDIATGELIAFVDSDDYIAPDMYACLYSLIEQGADIAECGHVAVMKHFRRHIEMSIPIQQQRQCNYICPSC